MFGALAQSRRCRKICDTAYSQNNMITIPELRFRWKTTTCHFIMKVTVSLIMNLYFLLFSEAYDPVNSVLKWLVAGIVSFFWIWIWSIESEVWLTYTLMINTFTFKQIKACLPAKSRHIPNIPSVPAISVSVQQRLRYEGNWRCWRHWSQWDARKRRAMSRPAVESRLAQFLSCVSQFLVWEPHRPQ